MTVTFDPAKRDRTLAEPGLAFADAEMVFSGPASEIEDDRRDYGERRMVVVGYVQRGRARHVLTIRKADDREQERFRQRLGKG